MEEKVEGNASSSSSQWQWQWQRYGRLPFAHVVRIEKRKECVLCVFVGRINMLYDQIVLWIHDCCLRPNTAIGLVLTTSVTQTTQKKGIDSFERRFTRFTTTIRHHMITYLYCTPIPWYYWWYLFLLSILCVGGKKENQGADHTKTHNTKKNCYKYNNNTRTHTEEYVSTYSMYSTKERENQKSVKQQLLFCFSCFYWLHLKAFWCWRTGTPWCWPSSEILMWVYVRPLCTCCWRCMLRLEWADDADITGCVAVAVAVATRICFCCCCCWSGHRRYTYTCCGI